jgi:hypothetical protein
MNTKALNGIIRRATMERRSQKVGVAKLSVAVIFRC